MTGEDLLETGVTVMARPPGKRNSSIQLLSGGEKALTAIALVFAIFELNVKAYPDAFNTYDSLGEAYMTAGQNDLAIANYQRSLDLNPDNTNATTMLTRLGGE